MPERVYHPALHSYLFRVKESTLLLLTLRHLRVKRKRGHHELRENRAIRELRVFLCFVFFVRSKILDDETMEVNVVKRSVRIDPLLHDFSSKSLHYRRVEGTAARTDALPVGKNGKQEKRELNRVTFL